MKKSASELATGGELVAHMDGEEMVWLLGQPHLTDYLAFVREKVIGGEHMSQRLLADEWRKANDLYYELEQSEAGFADGAECLPLPKEMRGLARALKDSGDLAGATREYDAAITWWRDADPDLPVLLEARRERNTVGH